MGDAASAAELTNFFAVAISVIFGLWFEKTEVVIGLKRPLAYAERGPYRRQIIGAIIGRALPIWVVMAVFIAAFAPTTLSILGHHSLSFGSDIDHAATIYCLMYWFLLYVFVVTTGQLWSLSTKLRHSRQGRAASRPSVTHL